MDILSAAVPLFAENGYDNTTIDHIAEKAEFGKGTIYNYFNSKEDIYLAIHEEIFTILLDSLTVMDKQYKSFYEFIEKITEEMFDFCVNNQHAFILIARHRTNLNIKTSKTSKLLNNYHKDTDAIIIRRIKKAIKKKEIKDIDPESFIILYRSMIFPYIYKKMFCSEDANLDAEKESKLIVDILFNGLKVS